jgi:hypothetical protein
VCVLAFGVSIAKRLTIEQQGLTCSRSRLRQTRPKLADGSHAAAANA